MLCAIVTVVAPISRSGALAAVSGVMVAWKLAGRKLLPLLLSVGASLLLLLVVYPPFYSRMTLPTFNAESRDTRRDVLVRYVETLPETAPIGVGSGNYYKSWGLRRGFPIVGLGTPMGMHNYYAQVAILWGVPAMLLYLAFTAMAIRAPFSLDYSVRLRWALGGFAVCDLTTFMFSHTFGSKVIVVSLGLLVAASCWRKEWSSQAPND